MKPTNQSQSGSRLRSFWLMFVVEFQNAFSDNLLRWLVVWRIVAVVPSETGRNELVLLVGALFALPFILFSMAGGFFADRFSKRDVTVAVKSAEIGLMAFALVGLWLNNIPLMLASVFLMSTHSAFFGPSKYGLLPELLPEKKLSWGNGMFGFGTFTAVIAGTIIAGWLSDVFGKRQIYSGAILIALALFGLALSLRVERIPAADPSKRFRADFLGDFFSQMKLIRRDRVLFLGVVGNAFLWFLGALLQLTIVFYGKDIFHLNDAQSGWLQISLSIGIGVGSFVAGFLSGGKIEYGLVPLGMAGLTVFAAMLSRAGLGITGFALDLGLLGFFGGFYNVPVNAIMQHRPDADNKGRVIAAGAWLSWVGVLLASGFYYLFAEVFHLTPPHIFLASAALSLAGTIYCVKLMPDSLIRMILWLATKTIYRIRVEGRDNIPEKGGALFVCNHVSFVDAPLLMASTDRKIRFIMDKSFYELWWINPFAEILGLIPVASNLGPRELLKSLQTASDSVRAGDVVCIFAEGKITRTGGLDEFQRGSERIMKNVDAPVVPVALVGVWGSIFSFERGKFFWKWPRHIFYPVTVRYGRPLPPTATTEEIHAAVEKLLTTDGHG
jgi:acyl-[acyl-carrier-protein]-phospholipid O-acyltransferase/long-chain-fatty-acid--[acyl-carrier-protein] ligase